MKTLPEIDFTELETVNIDDTDRVEVTAKFTSHKRRELALEHVIGRISKEDGVSRVNWRVQTLSV